MWTARGVAAAALIAAGFVAAAPASSQGYPSRPIRMILPSSTGSGVDITGRMIAPPLSERLGQQVVVENRAGAGTIIGTEIVAKSPPDGYTVLLAVGALATTPAIYKKVPFDVQRDLAAVTQVASVANVVVVHSSLPVKSVKDLIALAKAHPGEIAFASSGTGTNPQLAMELLMYMTGTKMLHVPYKGPTPGMIDLVAGRVQTMATSITAALPHVRAGRLRVIGVTTAKRAAVVPDIPTIAEGGVPGYEAVQWWGMLVPSGTPADVIARLHKDTVAVLMTQDIKERLLKEGMEVVGSTPQEFGAYVRSEMDKWAKIVKAAKIQPE